MTEILVVLILINPVIPGNLLYKFVKDQNAHNQRIENLLQWIIEKSEKA